jgi:GTP 3',8-cyclase
MFKEKMMDTVRLKTTERCQFACKFCHGEGNIDAKELEWNENLASALIKMKEFFGFNSVLYGGGEPTLNQNLDSITKNIKSLGFEVSATTNGQFSESALEKLMESGLREFNFSIHTLDPKKFLEIQSGRGKLRSEISTTIADEKQNSEKGAWTNIQQAKEAIEKQLCNILKIKELGGKVSINTVLSNVEDMEDVSDMISWAKKNEIPLRILQNVNDAKGSEETLDKLISKLEAKKGETRKIKGSSSLTTYYHLDNFRFSYKHYRDFKLKELCGDCEKSNECQEHFAAIRLQENDDGQFYVVLCLDRRDKKSIMPLDEFLGSPIAEELKSHLNINNQYD